ncbi:MAG: lipid carrier--UDP-N-acetylgalactosaminyltransferase [Blautia sp.]|uniref:PglD-related sugar-binding protein n=1 Tax=Blautia sp. TaxID=1955243 RepID=UPI002A75D50E|nr:lipid carrier--UDP-N-acetylgalactosaminyltransferase [Blautia sp.]MDY3017512.1 lipid carrier--UDP-N-acetylgalactosaminyltransferase [Blautia sp.]
MALGIIKMMEKLLLVGAGGFGRVVMEHAIEQQYEVAFVDDGYDIGAEVCSTKIVGHIEDLAILFRDYKKLVVAIGNNKFRESVYKKAEEIGYDFPNIICKSVYISPFSKIGKGCVLLNNVCVQNGASVGNGVLLNPGVEIHHDGTVDDYALIYSNSVVRTMAYIGKRVKIGSTCTISNEVVIESDQIIEDGNTVTK